MSPSLEHQKGPTRIPTLAKCFVCQTRYMFGRVGQIMGEPAHNSLSLRKKELKKASPNSSLPSLGNWYAVVQVLLQGSKRIACLPVHFEGV